MPWDENRLRSFFPRTREGWESLQALGQAFAAAGENTLAVLRAHPFDVNPEGWRAALARLREASALMGADDLVARLARWEAAAGAGDADALRRAPQTLSAALEWLMAEWREFLEGERRLWKGEAP